MPSHSGSVSVLDATYLGFVFSASGDGALARVGAPEHLDQERLGFVVEERNRPSAALETAAAVLVRAAKSLHHPIDGDVRDGGQLHETAPSRRVRCDLQQLTFSQRGSNPTAAPGPGLGELPECLACVLMALSAASERLVRLIELRAQLRDGAAQEFELGALVIAQFDAPIPCLICLSHRSVFAVRGRAPAECRYS